MAPKKQDPWPFTRLPDWYKSGEAREMQIWECMESTTQKIHADCTVGLDTVCLLYNWVDDGVLPMAWLQQKYPKVHAQVAEWADLAAKESAAKDAFARELFDRGLAPDAEPPSKKAKTSTGPMQGSIPRSSGSSASASRTMACNATGSGNGPQRINPAQEERM
jgi:hypothetical protein